PAVTRSTVAVERAGGGRVDGLRGRDMIRYDKAAIRSVDAHPEASHPHRALVNSSDVQTASLTIARIPPPERIRTLRLRSSTPYGQAVLRGSTAERGRARLHHTATPATDG